MNTNYQRKIELMTENYGQLKKDFKWDGDLSKHLVALNFAMQHKHVDSEMIKTCKAYLKEETGAFSVFRGQTMFALCGLISANAEDPKKQLQAMISNQPILKSVGFKQSSYLPTALYTLSQVYEGNDVEGYGQKAMEVYKEMKQNHPVLTGGDDYALAILLAGKSRNLDLLETYYQGLNKAGFGKTNGLQMLSHIMSFNQGNPAVNIEKCKHIFDTLKTHKIKVYSDYYATIGLMCLLDDDSNQLLNELIDIVHYLKKQKVYKWLGKGLILLMGAAIISSEFVDESNDLLAQTTVQVSIQTIIAAQQAAMIAAVGATAAATAAT